MTQKMTTGSVVTIDGSLVQVEVTDTASIAKGEIAYILHGEERIQSEIIKIRGNIAFMQVFEETDGLSLGETVEFTGEQLTLELGPGLLGSVIDGLGNPLNLLFKEYGYQLLRGKTARTIDGEKPWAFKATAKSGDTVTAGSPVGTVREGIIDHTIMIPYSFNGEFTIKTIAADGSYTLNDDIATIVNVTTGKEETVRLSFLQPVKVPVKIGTQVMPKEPMVTKMRIIDTLFPVAKGSSFCIPGPFGAGKTVTQQSMAKFSSVDVVIVAACGERAGEVVETIKEFPELQDPKTGRSLMERTVIICNTSSMPVAARESSVYTAVAVGEHYRQMGLDVLLLADSTSRWAQALRELSGRLEEIPGEEAFPAYLDTRLAGFYGRAGALMLKSGKLGTLTIGGTVSPAGGSFDEPVTQGTLSVVPTFLGLSRARGDARRFPAIDPLDSYSKVNVTVHSKATIQKLLATLRRSSEIKEMIAVTGLDAVSMEDYIIYLQGEFTDRVYLQQNAFDEVDAACPVERQTEALDVVLHFLNKTDYSFENKKDANAFFRKLMGEFVTWNGQSPTSEEYKTTKAKLLAA
ncbi:MAG: V-type ATP synthase subunit A [Deltaproteobacteria bacterium]|nr:V-type ATP synthase subunit A [Deltaproteobacteria bacterium]MBN2672624.1 V-type ATP synthase subunit A [Deltaproteobacteria bacterium]